MEILNEIKEGYGERKNRTASLNEGRVERIRERN